MEEVSVIKEKPKLVAGMRMKGHYRDISVMLPQLFELAKITHKGPYEASGPVYEKLFDWNFSCPAILYI